MTFKAKVVVHVVAAVILVLGWFPLAPQSKDWWIPFSVAFLALAFVTALEPCNPRTALALLVTTNISFWLWVGVFSMRDVVKNPPDIMWGGWGIVLMGTTFYHLMIFALGLRHREDRVISAVGLVGLGFQLFFSLGVVWAVYESV